jgi:hypothetical protein
MLQMGLQYITWGAILPRHIQSGPYMMMMKFFFEQLQTDYVKHYILSENLNVISWDTWWENMSKPRHCLQETENINYYIVIGKTCSEIKWLECRENICAPSTHTYDFNTENRRPSYKYLVQHIISTWILSHNIMAHAPYMVICYMC